MMEENEIKRYSRQVILPEIGAEGQEKLRRAKVLVVGAGGLGCPVLQYLAAAGVGTIGIIDGDVVEETNLHRQVLFSSKDIGKPKVEIAKQKLALLNPFCKLEIENCQLTSQNALGLINDYDLLIDGSDNFPTRYLVNDACVMLNKPFVSGSIFKFEGQVSVFNYKGGATYRCLFPEPPQDVPNCSETGVLGVLPGIIGTLMANEALKIILGTGEPLSGKLLVFNALPAGMQVISFRKNPAHAQIKSLGNYEALCGAGAVREISCEEFNQRRKRKEAMQVIDVREPEEYTRFNLQAENIPLGGLARHIDKIRRDVPVIIHCQKGGRSKKAVELLQKEYGFTNLLNLSGGIEEFAEKVKA